MCGTDIMYAMNGAHKVPLSHATSGIPARRMSPAVMAPIAASAHSDKRLGTADRCCEAATVCPDGLIIVTPSPWGIILMLDTDPGSSGSVVTCVS